LLSRDEVTTSCRVNQGEFPEFHRMIRKSSAWRDFTKLPEMED
jgi:hypothetical protein